MRILLSRDAQRKEVVSGLDVFRQWVAACLTPDVDVGTLVTKGDTTNTSDSIVHMHPDVL